jgi:hypothetical protein
MHRGDKGGPLPGIWGARDRPDPAAWRRDSSRSAPWHHSSYPLHLLQEYSADRENKVMLVAKSAAKVREIPRKGVLE